MNKVIFLIIACIFAPRVYADSCEEACRSGWNVTEELLYWYSGQELGYTNHPADILNTDNFTAKSVIDPSFDWKFGFRVGTGYTKRDWTFLASWMYLKSTASGQKNVDSGAPSFQGIFPIWSPNALEGDYVSSATLTWRLYTNIVDLYGQYNYSCLCNRLLLMPFIGGRGAFLDQKLHADYAGGTFFGGVDENRLSSWYYAGGPRFGLHADWYMKYGFSLFGRGAAAPLFGNLHIKQRETLLEINRFHRSNENYRFVLSTDYEIGLRWRKELLDDRMNVVLDLAWEGQEFFYANSFYRDNFHFSKKNRTLFMQGLTLSAALDF